MKIKALFFARTTLIIFFSCAFAFSAFAAEVPRIQLDEAERHFNEAYRRFLARDYWRAQDSLALALRANTFLIDYYLMTGLVMARKGNYGAGREALEYYLEVRPLDDTANRILSYMITQQRALQRILSPSPLPMRWQVFRTDLQSELDLGYTRAFSVRGLGKVSMWGSNLFLADTLGNRVIYRNEASRRPVALEVNRPVTVLPMNSDAFYIVAEGGEVYYFRMFSSDPSLLSPELVGVLENTLITDATMISEREFVVADSLTREVAFYSLATLTGAPMNDTPPTARLAAWSPPDNIEAFFEPVALSAYAQWLAVADRGGGRIFFLNLDNRREFFSADIPRPRDVTWSALGELFVINDDGDLFKVIVDFRDRRVEAVDRLESGLTNGWALFNSPYGDVYCMDIAGSNLWKAVPIPDASMPISILSTATPSVTWEEDRESFLLDAILMSPFRTYFRTAPIIAHVVWNNRAIPSFAHWSERNIRQPDVVLLSRPTPVGTINPAINSVAVENGTDIRIVLPHIWTLRRNSLTNLIIDSTVSMTQEDLNMLALFCLNNGVRLDVWARSVPSVEMVRAAALTGGKTIFSLSSQPNLPLPHSEMQVRIPLPQELSSSGFPSRSMLSLFLNVGFTQARNWIPLWPDMID